MSRRQPLLDPLRLLGMAGVGLLLVLTPATAQDTDNAPIIRFTPAAENPVLNRLENEAWGGECGTIFAPQVVWHENLFYLFYSGSCERSGKPAAIGYATSSDGIHWTKFAHNPILEPDGSGYDAMCVSVGVPLVEDNQWIMYYAANSTPCDGPGQHIGRAMASAPDGPWQRSTDPVLESGEAGAWDAGFIMPHAVIHSEQGYIMYYSSGTEFALPLPRLIGMATSPDGIHWIKYNDPATVEPPYANSDPIFEWNAADGAPEFFEAWAVDVQHTALGWEMFFSTTCPESASANCPTFIGYATSDDGIRWQANRSPDTAVLKKEQVGEDWASYCICQPSFIQIDSTYYLYFVGCTDNLNDCQIGLAVGEKENE